jgi:hypothetical protein
MPELPCVVRGLGIILIKHNPFPWIPSSHDIMNRSGILNPWSPSPSLLFPLHSRIGSERIDRGYPQVPEACRENTSDIAGGADFAQAVEELNKAIDRSEGLMLH